MLILLLFAALFTVACSTHDWFVPNQLAANVWYRPEGEVINGHIAGSFTNFSLWPTLQTALAARSGGFGVYAAELAFLSTDQLSSFKLAGLPIQAEDPTWTQCQSVEVISQLALYGLSPSGEDLFCTIFLLCNNTGRPSPTGLGWYLSSNGISYAPASIVFDERMPNLLDKPSSDPAIMAQLWNASLTWPERKAAAFVDPCPAMNNFRPGVDRIDSIIADYVYFVQSSTDRFGSALRPSFGVHWNVVAWWEWLDTECLDELNSSNPDTSAFKTALLGLFAPCHRDTEHLVALAKALCGNGTCPDAMYMDVDYLYNTSYAVDVLLRNKAALGAMSPPVPFGLNIVDQCGTALNCKIVDTGDALVAETQVPPFDPNMLHEESLLAMFEFFSRVGVIDAETRLRVASWSVRPQEQGVQVDERIPGSMAHTANVVFAA